MPDLRRLSRCGSVRRASWRFQVNLSKKKATDESRRLFPRPCGAVINPRRGAEGNDAVRETGFAQPRVRGQALPARSSEALSPTRPRIAQYGPRPSAGRVNFSPGYHPSARGARGRAETVRIAGDRLTCLSPGFCSPGSLAQGRNAPVFPGDVVRRGAASVLLPAEIQLCFGGRRNKPREFRTTVYMFGPWGLPARKACSIRGARHHF